MCIVIQYNCKILNLAINRKLANRKKRMVSNDTNEFFTLPYNSYPETHFL